MDELRLKALDLAKGKPATPKELAKVAGATTQEAAAWAFGQWELRLRAKVKFSQADSMLFGREALEQSTHEAVASYHARLFPVDQLVVDCTAGIGADLLALARRGPAVGFELDAERAEMARFNLNSQNLEAEVKVQDCLEKPWGTEFAFADPARRVESRRTLNPEEFSPNPTTLAANMRDLKLGVIKLSPLLSDSFLEDLAPRLEFISYDRECREVLAIMGMEAKPGRFAIHVESGEAIPDAFPPVEVHTPGQYLFDVDPAAVRAHAIGTLCARFDLSPLGTASGYLTGEVAIFSPWLRTYRVLYSGKADLKTTRRALSELDVRVAEVKQRGAKADVDKLRKELSTSGKSAASLVLWMDGASVRHTLAVLESQ